MSFTSPGTIPVGHDLASEHVYELLHVTLHDATSLSHLVVFCFLIFDHRQPWHELQLLQQRVYDQSDGGLEAVEVKKHICAPCVLIIYIYGTPRKDLFHVAHMI